jgi:Na+-transporting methylmalonyl-CoA/oxaloacetate decarboxylase gamma subunit
MPEIPPEVNESTGTTITFSEDRSRVNLVQYVSPESGNRVVTEIYRAIRIDAPATAEIGKPVNLSVSVYQGLSAWGIEPMAISPEGIFYPVENENITFDRAGHWGVIALIGDLVLLGKPIDVSEGGFKLVMPGLGTIFAALSLLLLLSLVPIWFMGQARGSDPYEEVAYRAYVIKKYIEKFDTMRLRRAVHQLKEEYEDLRAKKVQGHRESARAALEELETLASYQSSSNI